MTINNAFSDLPAGVKTEKYLSDDPLTCKSMGGNGEPCSYDIAENGSCHEKQYWSDNGWTEYQVYLINTVTCLMYNQVPDRENFNSAI